MKKYEQPKAEVVKTFAEDVIRTSQEAPVQVGDNIYGVLEGWE